MHRLLVSVASLVGAQALWHTGFSSCSLQALEFRLSNPEAHGIFSDQGSNQCPLHWQVDS